MKRAIPAVLLAAATSGSWTPGAHAQRSPIAVPRACRFKHAEWEDVRHTNATIAFANVETTAEWQDERSTMEENLQRNGQRYGYPRGYFRLSSALETVWGRIWEEAYWGEKYDEDTNPDDFGFDEQQAAVAKGRAYDAMKYAWYAIKAICPGR